MHGHRHHHRRGTVIAFFLVLVAVLTTALITSMALSSGVQTQSASLTLKRDQAFYAADAGIQRALWMAKYGSWAASGYPTLSGSAGTATYSVSVVSNDQMGGIAVHSIGTVNVTSTPVAVTSSINCTFGGAYPLAAVQLGGSLSGGGGAHITGNLMANGTISHNGNFNVNAGNVYAGSTIDSGISLDRGYALYPNSSLPPVPDVNTIAGSLAANSTAKTISSTSSLDFTQSSNGILVYNGAISSWKNPSITGNGTLVVYGDVSVKSMSSFTGHNVNLVIVGTLTALGGSKFNLQGSLYVKNDISSQSQFTVQGVILCNGNMNTQGQGSDISLVAPPWFDPRLSSPIGGYVTSKFTGPIF